MISLLLDCNNDFINLLLTNAVAKPLSELYQVFIHCEDRFAPLFVNNRNFAGAAEPNKEYDIVVGVGKQSSFKGKEVRLLTEYETARTKKGEQNLFQIFFSNIGLTWRGEGYDLHYFSRNRQKKDSVGVIIRNLWLKEYIIQNVVLRDTRIWDIPFKSNILKQLDEINRCSHIISDDETCVHVALALRKYVEYVVPKKPEYPTVMFGNGNTHIFDYISFSREGQHAQILTSKG